MGQIINITNTKRLGTLWIKQTIPGASIDNWEWCDISGDNIVICSSGVGGQLFFYNGTNWLEIIHPDGLKNWKKVTIAGNKIFAIEGGPTLRCYDSGVWSKVEPRGVSPPYYREDIDSDGEKVVACGRGNMYGSEQIICVYNGLSWTQLFPTGDTGGDFISVGLSGNNIILCGFYLDHYPLFYNGVSWTDMTGVLASPWCCASISGNKIIVGSSSVGHPTSFYNGEYWVTQFSDYTIKDVAMSGNKILAGFRGGGLYYNDGMGWVKQGTSNYVKSVAIDSKKMVACVGNDGTADIRFGWNDV